MKIFDIYINLFIFLVFTDLTIDYQNMIKKTNNNNNIIIEDNFLFLSFIKIYFPDLKNYILVLKIIFDIIYLYLFVKFLNRYLLGLFFMFIPIYKFIDLLTKFNEKIIQFEFSKKLSISELVIKIVILFMLNLLSFIQLFNYCKRKKNNEFELTFHDLDEIQIIR